MIFRKDDRPMETTVNESSVSHGDAAAEALLDKMYPTMKAGTETQAPAPKPQESPASRQPGRDEKPPAEKPPAEKPALEKPPAEKPATDQGEVKPEVRTAYTAEYGEIAIPELPHGTQLDEKSLNEFASLAREAGLPKAEAQKLLDFGGAKIKKMIEAPYKEWRDTQTKWQAEVKADPEIGGAKYDQSLKDVGLIFKPSESNPFCKTASEAEALRKALNWTGAGNNPAVVKFFVRAARLMGQRGSLPSKMYDKM